MAVASGTNPDQSRKETIRNAGIFSVLTFLSRILGLFRDQLKAFSFGTGMYSNAFDVAFRLPNMLRNLVAEGALTQAFVPVYESYRNEPDNARCAAGAMFGFLTISLTLICLIAWFTVPHFLPGLLDDPASGKAETRLTVSLTRVLFPYLGFMSISALFMAIQYAHGSFWAASFGPALLNIVVIVTYGGYLVTVNGGQNPDADLQVFTLVTLLSGLAQTVFQYLTLRSHGWAPPFLLIRHPIISQIFLLMAPAVFGAGVHEVGQLIDIYLAQRSTTEGAVSALTYAHRLIHLPIGIFAVAVATASLPQLSRMYSGGDLTGYRIALHSGIRLNLFLLLPASLGLMAFARPITGFVFEYGEFDAHSTEITSVALFYYSIGVPGYSLQKLFVSASYSRLNSIVPALIAGGVLLVNVVVAVLLLPVLQHAGLAMASSVAAYAGVVLYAWHSRKFLDLTPEEKAGLFRLLVFNVTFAALIFALAALMNGFPHAVAVAVGIPSGVLLYAILGKLFRNEEYEEVMQIGRRLLQKLRNRGG